MALRGNLPSGRAQILVFTFLLALAVAFPAGAEGAVPKRKLVSNLGALWTKVFETEASKNPFGGDPDAVCWALGGNVVAPFGPAGAPRCVVKTGTKIFVAASSVECSNVEGNGEDEGTLRACARAADAHTPPQVTLDGRPISVAEVETGLMKIDLPEGNVFGVPPQQALSVAHGWVALLHPLTPGTHQITIRNEGADPITTTIVVKPGRKAVR